MLDLLLTLESRYPKANLKLGEVGEKLGPRHLKRKFQSPPDQLIFVMESKHNAR